MAAEGVEVVTISAEDRTEILLSLGTTYGLIEQAVQMLDDVPFEDEEIAVLLTLPEHYRMRVTARLVELTESLRTSLRQLDGRLLQLTERDA